MATARCETLEFSRIAVLIAMLHALMIPSGCTAGQPSAVRSPGDITGQPTALQDNSQKDGVATPPGHAERSASPNSSSWNLGSLDTARRVPYLTEVEKDIFLELNKVRADPALYASTYLEPRRHDYHGRIYRVPGQTDLLTSEGLAALEECIRVLRSTPGRGVLLPSRGLSQAARDHVEDAGPRGLLGHTGTDGSSLESRVSRYGTWQEIIGENIAYGAPEARNTVIQMLIDDGVPSRGHRNNILQERFGTAGVAAGPHRTFRTMWVLDFAGRHEDHP